MRNGRYDYHSSRRRGATVVVVAVSLVTLLICASLAIDVGYMCALAAEQQNNADASALAGASGLRDAAWQDANERAIDLLELNQPPQGYLSLDDQVIEFGWFDSVAQAFHVLDDPDDAFAVRVRAARNGVALFFAPLMGHNTTDVRRPAVAIGSKACGGIWGLEGIKAGSISTDSFDSTISSYDAATAGERGNLCSGRGITVEGSFEVHGDVMTGFGYPLEVNGTSGQISGLTTSRMDDVEPPPADFGEVAYINDNRTIGLTDKGVSPWNRSGSGLRIASNDNLTILGGTYYFSSITLTGGSTITIKGTAVFYVTGSIDAAGGSLINRAAAPGDLSIVSSGSSIKLSGGTEFYGSILAPNAAVALNGNAIYYGALIGKTLSLGGDVQIHVDESLPLNQPWFEPPFPSLVQ